MKFSRLLLLGATVIALSGCILDDDDDPATPPPAPAPAPAPTTTIVDVAVADGNFTTLVAALQATGLDATLDDESASFTVFAPTDAAFALLGQDTIDALLADTDALSAILLYHVLGAQVDAATAISLAGTTQATANGASIALSLSGGNLLVNGSTVTMTDITTDNGIIHAIDAVLIPPTVTDASTSTIAEVAVADGNFTTLVAALDAAGLVGTLSDTSQTFTVFAPTDAAFAMIDPDLIAALLQDSEALSSILLQHVVAGAAVDSVTAMSLSGTSVETASGAMIPIAINPETDTLTVGGATVTTTDIQTANGIIHVIDMVIVGDVTLPTPADTITDVAASVADFSTLVSLLQSTGLDAVLDDRSAEFTVFAPTNDAFAQVDPDTLAALANDADALANVLTYHVFGGATVLQDAAVSIASGSENKIEMVNGQQAALSLSGSDLYINTSRVSTADVMADNGVIHIIDQVILPPAMRGEPANSIVEIAVGNPDFSTLVAALTAADLVGTLSTEGATFTVFAPTNAAFDKIDDAALDGLLGDVDALTSVLLQHVIVGAAVDSVSAFAANGSAVNTAANDDVTIDIINFTQGTNDASSEVTYDAVNGRLVGGAGSSQPGFTLYTFDPDLGTSSSACVDGCATNWPPVMVSDGMASGIPGLSSVARADGGMQAAFQGRPLYFFINDTAAGDAVGQGVNDVWYTVELPQTALSVQGSIVTTTDIYATNGVIHVIDSVITETLTNGGGDTGSDSPLVGTWRVAPEAGSLGVGPAMGDISWWNIDDAGVSTRACFYDDDYIFNADGSFENVLGDETWLEGWQHAGGDECGAPIAPYDGSGDYSWEYDMQAGTLTLTGMGGYIGIPKAVNDGEIGNPDNLGTETGTRVYMVDMNEDNTRMVVDIETGTNVWWRFVMAKQ